jgi:UDP-N-acetylmuramyl pentapeptide synthase
MLELGSVSKEAHEQVGRELAAKGVDALLTRGEMGLYIAEAAKAAGLSQVCSCDSHAEAGRMLKKILQPGDTILFKGSRGMQMEKIIDLL